MIIRNDSYWSKRSFNHHTLSLTTNTISKQMQSSISSFSSFPIDNAFSPQDWHDNMTDNVWNQTSRALRFLCGLRVQGQLNTMSQLLLSSRLFGTHSITKVMESAANEFYIYIYIQSYVHVDMHSYTYRHIRAHVHCEIEKK